jgi:RNA polymerase sigma-70 factor (ECF subfamily)
MRVSAVDWREEDVGAVYRQHAGRLWRSLLLSTRSPEIASDAVAEAFAQAIRRWSELRDPAAWIWRAAYRIAAGEIATAAATRSLEELPDVSLPEPTVETLDVLASLTEHQRRALVLHAYAGYSYREVAEILGSTVAAVGVHIHRAKKKLRDNLEANDA